MADKAKWQTPKSKDYRQYKTLDELLLDYIQCGKALTKAEARRKAYRDIPKENYYQGRILKMLSAEFPDGRWRKNAAGIGQAAGEPDIIGCYHGYYVAVECKRPLVGEPTELQLKAIAGIRDAGGFAMVAVYPEEVYEPLMQWLYVRGG